MKKAKTTRKSRTRQAARKSAKAARRPVKAVRKPAKVPGKPARKPAKAAGRAGKGPVPDYLNTALPREKRVADLVGRMTAEEKVSQMVHTAAAVERLGVPPYNWWSEGLHGVGRAGRATVFPQAVGLAATWDEQLIGRVATAIADEARAKHHEAARHNRREIYQGLTFWSPNVNIFRDPRWGRGHETFGEDPHLTGRLGVAFVRGLQGDDPKYLKVVATPKHLAVHSGPESLRHKFDARISPRDLWDTYLPAFELCVKEGQAASVMGAYNRVNGEAACASPTLLQKILREKWGFAGYVVSDCWAIEDIWHDHGLASTAAEAAAMALKAGCQLSCSQAYHALLAALDRGLVAIEDIDKAVTLLFEARFRLGMFDPPGKVGYARTPIGVVDSPAHRELALQAGRESIVLLKNDGVLPLRKDLRSIGVIGPNAQNLEALVGNYNGWNGRMVSVLEGIVARISPMTKVQYAHGCHLADSYSAGIGQAVWMARDADVIVAVVGLSGRIEGEQGESSYSTTGGDRASLELPGVQLELLKELHKLGKPLIVVYLGGSAVDLGWAQENAAAVLCGWYPGQAGGEALAEAIFGHYNPAGRLPVTFYKSVEQLPPFEDYTMEGRTYRYFRGEPLYPFGYGLSYTQFAYDKLKLSAGAIGPGDALGVSVEVRNVGAWDGDEVVQVYLTDLEASAPVAIRRLAAFRRIHLKAGKKRVVKFTLPPAAMSMVDEQGRRIVEPGRFALAIGGGQPGTRSEMAGSGNILKQEFIVTGPAMEVDLVS